MKQLFDYNSIDNKHLIEELVFRKRLLIDFHFLYCINVYLFIIFQYNIIYSYIILYIV